VHDVLIVGASVAGAATALHMAQRGRRVLVIDRASFPRRKACGEGIFPNGVAELERLGLLPGLAARGVFLEELRFSIDGLAVAAPMGGRAGLGIQRRLLDAALIEAARTTGVEVCLGRRATGLRREGGRYTGVDTDAGSLDARVIVAADGLGSGLRREADLDAAAPATHHPGQTGRRANRSGRDGQRYGVSAHVRLTRTPLPRVDVAFLRGYEVYVTPVGSDLLNVAVLSGRAGMRDFAGRVAEAFRERVAAAGVLPERWELVDEPLAAGPFATGARRLWRDNLVLTGDAAGFFDAVTGEGISLSLLGARACAAAIDAYLETGDERAFAAYAKRRRALAAGSTLLGRLCLFLAARPVLSRAAIRNLGRRPRAFAGLVAASGEELSLTAIRPRDLLTLVCGV